MKYSRKIKNKKYKRQKFFSKAITQMDNIDKNHTILNRNINRVKNS